MKKLIALLLVLMIFLSLIGCASAQVTLPATIVQVTISWNGGMTRAFSYTDAAKIDQLVSCFSSLELKRTFEDPMSYNGGGWLISIESGDEIYKMHHYGNRFFQTIDGKRWEISYDQADAFDAVLKENVPDVLPEQQVFS